MDEETLFHAARAKPAAEHAPFLDAACAGDDVLRRRVESLLRHDDPGSILAPSPFEILAGSAVTVDPRPPHDPPAVDHDLAGATGEGTGSWVGRYQLLERIGEGGM